MMTAVESYLQKGRRGLRQWVVDPRFRMVAAVLGYWLAGFILSAASLANAMQPVAMGLICAVTGWRALVMTLGSMGGCWVFWGQAGTQGMVWAVSGCVIALFLGKRKITEKAPLLIPAIGGFLVSAAGLAFQIAFRDDTPVPIYLLRILVAAGSAWLFSQVVQRKGSAADWTAQGLAVLALAQVAPIPQISLGFVAGGLLAAGGAFPAAALAGLALDLSGICKVPMTAVLCLGYLVRMIPFGPRWLRYAAPGAVYLLIMGLCDIWDPVPIAGLAIGGALGVFLPPRPETDHRRGETGLAQVRLELMAGVLNQTQQLLLEAPAVPIDEEALLERCRERACGGCPNRKQCRDVRIPSDMLTRQLTDTACLNFPCRKPGRMLLELRRTQEQYRNLKAQKDRQKESREAVMQQYYFLGEYLRQTADQLAQRINRRKECYQVEVGTASAGKERANGDRCLWFSGTECRYYIVLCDGMGTGLGAAQEAQEAAGLLRQMLGAGFPAEYALRSLNSLMVLRGKAAAVTVDLVEIQLDSGKAAVFKWGAAPSYVLRGAGAEKIGTAGPPPGLSVSQTRETVDRLSLRRGEVLILFSDGADPHRALRQEGLSPEEPPGELAAKLLEQAGEKEDDATVAVIRLSPTTLST